MKKSMLILLSVVAFMLALQGIALATGTIQIIVKGAAIQSDVAPQIINGRVMVPIRVIEKTLNEDLVWDASSKSVIIRPEIWGGESGFGFQGEKWPQVRNLITKYLMAIEEKESVSMYVNEDFITSNVYDDVVFHDIKFMDAKSDGAEYTVRVSYVMYDVTSNKLLSVKQDFTINQEQLKIERIEPTGSSWLREYTVFPGFKIMTPPEG